MIKVNKSLILSICLALAGSSATALEFPSGLAPELREVLVDDVGGETWLRFRFVAPQIDPTAEKTLGFSDIEGDLAILCDQLALPYMEKHALTAEKVVVSISDRYVAYGATDAEATQYFEQFRIADGDCIWEGF